jgi:hypothetical protein
MPEHGQVTARLFQLGSEPHGPCVTASISLSWQESRIQEINMRTTFNIELKVDVLTTDAERLHTFIDLVANTARMLYGSAAMIASKPPTLTVVSDGINGRMNHIIFAGEESSEK